MSCEHGCGNTGDCKLVALRNLIYQLRVDALQLFGKSEQASSVVTKGIDDLYNNTTRKIQGCEYYRSK